MRSLDSLDIVLFQTDKYHETEISNSLILPSLTSEAHLFRQLFNYSMPVGSSQRNELAGSQLENWEDICHFESMFLPKT